MDQQIKLQKKVSVAKVFGKVNAAIIAKTGGNEIHVMRILGSASGVKSGVSDYGDWKALSGQFRATNPETGEQTDAATAFLPDVALDMITGALDGGATAVDFAFDIFAVLDDSSSVGYTYRASPLLQAAEDSPINRIAAKLQAMLPAPKTDEKKGGKK